jgi:hypothetical protein
MYTSMTASTHVVCVRWHGPTLDEGYDIWTGDAWVPVTLREVKSYVGRGFLVHMNPAWDSEGRK